MISRHLKDIMAGKHVDVFDQDDFEQATACLLMGVACQDHDYDVYEFMTISDVLASAFGISREEADRLIAAAQHTGADLEKIEHLALAMRRFVSMRFRRRIVAMAWAVAMSDHQMDQAEERFVSKIGEWLYLGAAEVRELKAEGEELLDEDS